MWSLTALINIDQLNRGIVWFSCWLRVPLDESLWSKILLFMDQFDFLTIFLLIYDQNKKFWKFWLWKQSGKKICINEGSHTMNKNANSADVLLRPVERSLVYPAFWTELEGEHCWYDYDRKNKIHNGSLWLILVNNVYPIEEKKRSDWGSNSRNYCFGIWHLPKCTSYFFGV